MYLLKICPIFKINFFVVQRWTKHLCILKLIQNNINCFKNLACFQLKMIVIIPIKMILFVSNKYFIFPIIKEKLSATREYSI